jgi:hypothetical protein
MPFVLIVAGVVLLVAAIRDTQQQLFYLVAGDFTGKNNFIYWFLSIVIIGAVGYIPRMKPISDGFLILVILTLFLKKGAFFDQFQAAIGTTQAARPVVSAGSGGGQYVGGGGGSPSISITPPNISLPGGVTIGTGR